MVSPVFSEICVNVSPDRTVQYGSGRRAIAWLDLTGLACVAAPSGEVVTTTPTTGHQRHDRSRDEKARSPAPRLLNYSGLHRRSGVHRVERGGRRLGVQVPRDPADRRELAAAREFARDLGQVGGRESGDHHAGAPRIDDRCASLHRRGTSRGASRRRRSRGKARASRPSSPRARDRTLAQRAARSRRPAAGCWQRRAGRARGGRQAQGHRDHDSEAGPARGSPPGRRQLRSSRSADHLADCSAEQPRNVLQRLVARRGCKECPENRAEARGISLALRNLNGRAQAEGAGATISASTFWAVAVQGTRRTLSSCSNRQHTPLSCCLWACPV